MWPSGKASRSERENRRFESYHPSPVVRERRGQPPLRKKSRVGPSVRKFRIFYFSPSMIRTRINLLRQDNFLKNNLVFFLGSMGVAFLNYLYHPILGRMMKVEDFGEVQSLLSLSAQAGIILGIFGTISVNIVTNSEGDKQKLTILARLYRVAFWLNVAISLIMVVLSVQLKHFFNFDSFLPFVILAVSLLISNPFTFLRSYLQGKKEFKAVSWSGIIISAGRLFFAVLLIYLGFAVLGAFAAIVISNLLALGFVYLKTKKRFRLKKSAEKEEPGAVWRELKYGILIFFATGFVTFLYTTDVLVVKHYFSPEEAGFYSGISTIARIIFFVTGSVAGVMLPSIKLKNSFQENSQILKKALLLVLLIGGGVFLTFVLFSATITNLLIGSRYVVDAHLLPRLGLLSFLVSIINLMFIYFLALRKYFLIPVTLLGLSVVSLSFLFFHASLIQVINSFLLGSFLALFLIIAYYAKHHLKNNENTARSYN